MRDKGIGLTCRVRRDEVLYIRRGSDIATTPISEGDLFARGLWGRISISSCFDYISIREIEESNCIDSSDKDEGSENYDRDMRGFHTS